MAPAGPAHRRGDVRSCRGALGAGRAITDHRPLRSLRDLIAVLEAERGLVRVGAPVASDQEIAEIHRRVAAADGPALLFTRVDDGTMPVITNLFGTRRRAELSFGRRAPDLVRRLARFAEEALPPTLGKLWAARDLARAGFSVGTRRRHDGPVLSVSEEPGLARLPLLKLWPADGGHFMTLPLVLTRSPVDGRPNLGIYRMQRFDDRTTGMHWQIGKGGGFHHHEAEARGEKLPATVLLGGPPALILAAVAPLPEGIPELLLASLILGERLDMVAAGGVEIPLECELAITGHVPAGERRAEGPFGDHYGYYSLRHPYPVFHAERVYRRHDAIWPATVVGKPRQEDFHIGDCLQELLAPLFPLVMPSVRDLWSYGETGFHSLAAAVVRDRYGREAMMSAFRILGEGQLSLTKFLLVTDTPQDLRDFPALLAHVLARTNLETDLYVFSHLAMDSLDYAGPEVNRGSKGVLLGLGPAVRELPRGFEGTLPSFVTAARTFCPGCLVVGGAGYEDDRELAARIAACAAFSGWPLVVLCDRPAQAAASAINFLWTAFTRFDPASDLHAADERVVRGHVCRTAPLVLDARMKPWYPAEVFADPEIARRVERRWNEYFPTGGVEMGSSDLGHITPV